MPDRDADGAEQGADVCADGGTKRCADGGALQLADVQLRLQQHGDAVRHRQRLLLRRGRHVLDDAVRLRRRVRMRRRRVHRQRGVHRRADGVALDHGALARPHHGDANDGRAYRRALAAERRPDVLGTLRIGGRQVSFYLPLHVTRIVLTI